MNDTHYCVYYCTDCSSDQFTCGNGDCVSTSHVCDAVNDCEDSSDENNCTINTPELSLSDAGLIIIFIIHFVVCEIVLEQVHLSSYYV